MNSCTKIRFYGFLVCVLVFSLSPSQPVPASCPGAAQMPSLFFGFPENDEQKSKKKPEDKRKKEEEEKEEKKEGKLGEFEKEATGKDAKKGDPWDTDTDDDDDDDYSLAESFAFIEVGFQALARGGQWSWTRVHHRGDPGFPVELRRMTGEPVLPFVNIDIGYQNVESDVEAADVRAELGYGPLALQFRETHYEEKDPFDKLDIIQWHILYRMSFPRFLEIDVGLGSNIIHGDDTNSGFSFTLPIRFQPHRWVGFQFRPNMSSIQGNAISDLDLGVSVGSRYVFFRAGYRWVTSDGASLNGPFFGVALHL